MCANYRPPPPRHLRLHFDALEPTFEYKEETYPGYSAPMLMAADNEPAALVPVRGMFGLVPFWAKDTKIARQTYNARSETVETKNSYRAPWRKRQFCLIPVEWFYEPNYETGKPVRWKIQRADSAPFALAALWESRKDEAGFEQRSFSLLTINADEHPLMRRFHGPEDEKRSVVVIEPVDYAGWLKAADDGEARSYLRLFSANQFIGEAAPKSPRTPA